MFNSLRGITMNFIIFMVFMTCLASNSFIVGLIGGILIPILVVIKVLVTDPWYEKNFDIYSI